MKSRFVPNLNTIPHGSGVDSLWKVDDKGKTLVLSNTYYGMTEGIYDGFADFSIRVSKKAPTDFRIVFHGKGFGGRGFRHKQWFLGLREYLEEIFADWIKTCTLEEPAWVFESGYGDNTYKLGFQVGNGGFLVYVYSSEHIIDALETVGEKVYNSREKNLPRILRADKAYEETLQEDGQEVADELFFPVNGGQHYICYPEVIEEV